MPKIKAVIFDLDGTLIRLPVDWRGVKARISSELRKPVRSIIELYAELWGSKEYDRISRIVEEYEIMAADQYEILDDSPTVLARLSCKYALALVTLQTSKLATSILADMGVLDLFSVIVGRDLVPIREKQIKAVLKYGGWKPQEVAMVGDLGNDVEAALKVGCHAILVDRGYGSVVEKYRREKIVPVIKDLRELDSILKVA